MDEPHDTNREIWENLARVGKLLQATKPRSCWSRIGSLGGKALPWLASLCKECRGGATHLYERWARQIWIILGVGTAGLTAWLLLLPCMAAVVTFLKDEGERLRKEKERTNMAWEAHYSREAEKRGRKQYVERMVSAAKQIAALAAVIDQGGNKETYNELSAIFRKEIAVGEKRGWVVRDLKQFPEDPEELWLRRDFPPR